MNEFFEPIYNVPSALPSRLRPVNNNDLICFGPSKNGFEAYIHREVLGAIEREAQRARPDETIGLLAGRVWQDNKGEYAVVLAIEGALKGEIDAGPSHVRISAAGNANVRNRLERAHVALDVIGWYHSHPSYPPEFSLVDIEEQTTWKDLNSIGIVYSGLPGSESFGVYQGPDAEKLSRQKPPPPEPIARRMVEHQEGNDGKASSKPVTHTFEQVRRENSIRVPARLRDTNLPLWLIALGVIGLLVGMLWIGHRAQRVESKLGELIYNLSQQMAQRDPTDESGPSGASKTVTDDDPPLHTGQDLNTQPQRRMRPARRNKSTNPNKPKQSPKSDDAKPVKSDPPANKKSSTDTTDRPGVKNNSLFVELL